MFTNTTKVLTMYITYNENGTYTIEPLCDSEIEIMKCVFLGIRMFADSYNRIKAQQEDIPVDQNEEPIVRCMDSSENAVNLFLPEGVEIHLKSYKG